MTEKEREVLPRLRAIYRPQRWVNDYAVDIDEDSVDFYCTTALLTLAVEQIHRFRFNDYCTHYLAEHMGIGEDHYGPSEVDVDQEEFREFWVKNGVEDWKKITQTQLDEIRLRYGVTETNDGASHLI